GWSMGGGIALRTSVRSAHRERIAAPVLDSPAVDWQDILIYHATALKAPAKMRELALWMMTSSIGARLVRLREPLALHEMTPAYYTRHLIHPTLLFHALDDETVPPEPSRQLAAMRPDLIEFVPVEGASHTREWNRDPVRYERRLVDYLVRVLDLQASVGEVEVPVRDPAVPALEGSIWLRLCAAAPCGGTAGPDSVRRSDVPDGSTVPERDSAPSVAGDRRVVADEQRAELPGLVVPGSAQHAGGGAAHGAVGGGEAQLVQEAVRRQAPQRRGPALGLHRAQPARRQLLQRLRRRVRHDHLLRGDPGPARGLLGDVGAGEQVGGLIHLDRLRQHPAARPDRQGRPRGPARPTGRA